MMASCNLNIRETGAGWGVLGQSRLHSKTLSQQETKPVGSKLVAYHTTHRQETGHKSPCWSHSTQETGHEPLCWSHSTQTGDKTQASVLVRSGLHS